MRQINLLIICTLFLFINTNVQSQILYNDEGYIPQSCQVEWTNAGLLASTPIVADNVFNVNDYSGSDNDRIHAALNDARVAAGTSIVYIPAGTYQVTTPIELEFDTDPDLNASNIIIQGDGTAGTNATILEFTVGNDGTCFYIHGTCGGAYSIDNNINMYNTSFVCSSTTVQSRLAKRGKGHYAKASIFSD